MEKTLIMLCGCPGSGKSTWTQQYKENKKVVIISRDEIRFRLVSEKEEYFSKETQVFNIFISEIGTKTILLSLECSFILVLLGLLVYSVILCLKKKRVSIRN